MKKRTEVMNSSEAIEARLEDMERRLDRLRALYESFFTGVERTPPAVPRRELNRLMVEMQQENIRNSSLRFRHQSIQQRWVLMTTYWNRTLREIESGTYRRDLARVQHRMAKQGRTLTEADAIAMGIPSNRAKAFVATQERLQARRNPGEGAGNKAESAPPPPAATVADLPRPPVTPPANSPTAPRAPIAVPGVSEAGLQTFWARYVDAHVKQQGAVPKISLDQMRSKLAQELPRVLAAKQCAALDLDVAVENGKVMLKARPQRG